MGFIINTLVYLLIVPVLLFIVVRKIDKRYHVGGDIRLLALACTLFALAMFYPTPLIHGQNTQFTTHLIGGATVDIFYAIDEKMGVVATGDYALRGRQCPWCTQRAL